MRHDGADDLGLVLVALNKQRTNRPIDQAGGQNLLLARARLAFEEAARNLTGSIGFFLVVDAQWEEVEARTGFRLANHGAEHRGAAIGGHHRAVSLTRDLPSFQY